MRLERSARAQVFRIVQRRWADAGRGSAFNSATVPNWNPEPKSFRLDVYSTVFCSAVPVVLVRMSHWQTPPCITRKEFVQKQKLKAATQMRTHHLMMPRPDQPRVSGSGTVSAWQVSPGSEMTPWGTLSPVCGSTSVEGRFIFYLCSLSHHHSHARKMRLHRFKGQPQNHLTVQATTVMGSSTGR
jgi:hypothetical protein